MQPTDSPFSRLVPSCVTFEPLATVQTLNYCCEHLCFHHHRHSPWLAPPDFVQASPWCSHDPLDELNISGSTWRLSGALHCSISL